MLHQRHHKDVAARLDAAVGAVDRAPRLKSSLLREALARLSPPATIEAPAGRADHRRARLLQRGMAQLAAAGQAIPRAPHECPGRAQPPRADAGRALAHVAMAPLLGVL